MEKFNEGICMERLYSRIVEYRHVYLYSIIVSKVMDHPAGGKRLSFFREWGEILLRMPKSIILETGRTIVNQNFIPIPLLVNIFLFSLPSDENSRDEIHFSAQYKRNSL